MSAWKYKRIMTKVTVAKLQLMKPKQITDLLGTDLRHIFSTLEKTQYNIDLSKIDSNLLNSTSIEGALLKNFVRASEKLLDSSPKDIRQLISSLITKFEVNCVKAMLRTKKAELPLEEALDYIIPAGNLDEVKCKQILESSENIADIIQNLSSMQYGSDLENAFLSYQEDRIFYLLEVALDRYVYSRIWKSIEKLSGSDKKIARSVLGLEIDSANIKTILRCKEMGIRDDQIKRYVIPVSEVLGEKEFNYLIKAPDTQSFINSLVRITKSAMARDYYYIFTELQQQEITSLITLEKILNKGIVKTSLRMIKRHTPYFNLGLILAYLNMKWFEVKNLIAVIRGSEAGISPEKVKKTLILP